tara:strand:+ start:1347 stop:2765 length:1419 start_codon:yes stop_codon:yes gene_type:complete
MAINRSQFPELMGYQEGGLISSFDIIDPFAPDNDLLDTLAPQVTRLSANTDEPKQDFAKDLELQLRAIEAARKMKPLELETPEFDFGAEFDDYQERLKKLLGKPAPVNFYDLVSDLGQAMLTTDPTVGPFRSAGIGFANFNQRMKKKDEELRMLDRQAGLKAFELAKKDEDLALDFLNKRNLEKIKAQQKKQDMVTFQYDILDQKGEKIGVDDIPINANNPIEMDLARSLPNAKLIKQPQTQVTIGSGNDSLSDQRAKSFSTALDLIKEEAKNAEEILFNVNQLEKAAERANYETGLVAEKTFGIRKLFDELGVRYDANIDEQELINTINTRLALLLVAQTKGPISDREMTTFQRAMPGLAASAGGLKKQIKFMRALANYQKKFFDDFIMNDDIQEKIGSAELSISQKENAFERFKLQWKKDNPRITADDEDFTILELANTYGQDKNESNQALIRERYQDSQNSISFPDDED